MSDAKTGPVDGAAKSAEPDQGVTYPPTEPTITDDVLHVSVFLKGHARA